MADIPVEKKSGGGWWKWLLGLLLAALLIWLLFEIFETDEPEMVEAPVVEEPATPETTPGAAAGAMSLSAILNNPDQYIGETFPDTEVQVAEVPTDRGFWISEGNQRLFAVIIDVPQEQPKDINPGQQLQITDGTLRAPSYLPQIEGRPLDQQTQDIAEQQEIVLVVDERYITVQEGGQPQPGTDPAEAVQ